MNAVDIGDGIIIDADTGELLSGDVPDRLLAIVRRMVDADSQVKAWERVVMTCKALLLKEQDEKRAVYDDVVVSVRQNVRKSVDGALLANRLAQTEVPREALLALVASSAVPVAAVVEEYPECIRETLTKAFIVAEKVRKRAPETN